MNLQDLQNLDPNNISAWPLPIKLVGIAIVAVGILFAGWYFIIQGELDELELIEKQEQELRSTFLNKKALAINLPAYKQQMEEMQLTFGSLLRQLPDSAEVPDLLIDITQAGLGRGLEFVLFKPEPERPVEFYAELPISIEVTGNYHELGLFVSDVAALPRIVTFDDIKILSGKGDKLKMSAKAKTYRYLTAKEIQQANEASKPAKGRRR
ncbi:MAG: type 4a pilus biogenesis protein PilO [Gammaproteobacteria bacterium]|nr:type 4a pilus biogenesis protein PilO [Gammaproteobacteria bacterium]